MNKVLNQTALATGVSVQDILNNQANLDFMEYTSIIEVGDANYLNHIVQYIEDLNHGIYINHVNEIGEIRRHTVSIAPTSSKIK